MQLDARRAASDGALDLAGGAVVRINTAERNQPSLGGLRGGEHPVVGGAIAIGFGQREDDRAPVDGRERTQQLIDPEAGPVRIGTANVRVAVKDRVGPSRSCKQENRGSSSASAATPAAGGGATPTMTGALGPGLARASRF